MAAALVEGEQYGLDSNISTSGNKTFIHFKLTDSALRAIEEYSKIKEGCSRKPTIKFNNNSGVINIPGQVSSDDPKAERQFHVSLSKILGDANGSFDCVQQTKTRHGVGLSCLGSMQYKVNTHANNDVYSDTRKKIAIADTESKKACAKEIKMSGRFSGKKIKKVIPSSQYNALNPGKPASLPPARHAATSHLSSSSSTLPHSSAPLSTSSRLASSPLNPVSDSRPSSSATKSSSSMVSSNNGILKIGNSSGEKCDLMIGTPIRERVIHLLALRSYKKPELVYRLMKDGIHAKDRDTLDDVLKSIAVTYKDSKYGLAKHAWQFFQPDWPLYSEVDKVLAKRNQQQAEARSSVSPPAVFPAVGSTASAVSPAVGSTASTVSPAVGSTASAISPTVRSTASTSPSPPQKRFIEEPVDLIPGKKRRIAHVDKRLSSHPLPQNGKTSSGPLPTDSTRNNHHQHRYPYNQRTSIGSTGSTGSVSSVTSDGSVDSVVTGPCGAIDKDSLLPESPDSNCENQGKAEEQVSSVADYLLQFSKIGSCEQRRQYEETFIKEYTEYRRLYEKVENVSKRFEHLKERINNTQEGSKMYEELRNLVLKEYKHHKSNTQFQRHKQRLDFLHNKLAHIKQMILEHDRDFHLSPPPSS
ncbi:RNA polymerase II elongation factor ELL-like isoform X2 [Babylonia areolata]|uniref:RNA polymerase II elongation factor ELL-like isoform X2 n=1 Tax=Babylonia areolata TaxID=304850 RepID=UPI003FD05915